MTDPRAVLLAGALAAAATPATAAGAEAPAGEAFRCATDASSVSIHAGERLVLEYRYAKVPFKPYVKRLVTPGGRNVLRDAPHDHLHHHALMFAVAVDGVDFWAEHPQCGRQVHRSFDGVKTGRRRGVPVAGFTEHLDWVDRSGKNLLRERRQIGLSLLKGANASLLTWRSRLAPPAGRDSVKLTGSHYFGLGMRFLQSMDGAGTFVYAEAKPRLRVRGDEHLAPAAWCAYAGAPKGKPVTAGMFGHPGNPRGPALWFTMRKPFAYLSATMNLWKQPLTVRADKPLELTYAVAVWDGRAEPARIDKLYRRWAAWMAPEAKTPSKRSQP
jgi:hypothetical protein